MRLHVLSDLHLRYAPFQAPSVDADAIVLVGDIARGTAGVRWAHEQFPDRLVLYVLGNHEFYRGCIEDVRENCRREAERGRSRIHILENGEYLAGGVAFLGATLWTGFDLFGESGKPDAIAAIYDKAPDYHVIRVSGPDGTRRALQPQDTIRTYEQSLGWLETRIRHHHEAGNRVCVMTHFAPSRVSLAARFAHDPVSAYFVNPLDAWIRDEGPALWLHGHTHDGFDYRIGRTRVLCNPRGYPGERDPSAPHPFDPGLVVEI